MNTGYFEKDGIIKDRNKIAKHYLKTSEFTFDILSVVILGIGGLTNTNYFLLLIFVKI